MEILRQKFTIHPVGQGFFYSGLIETSLTPGITNHYRIVFDCGSLNKTNCLDEVIKYRKVDFQPRTKLDLLISSHFDEDHVNHIHELLDNR